MSIFLLEPLFFGWSAHSKVTVIKLINGPGDTE